MWFRSTIIAMLMALAGWLSLGCDRQPPPSERPEAQLEAARAATSKPSGPSAIDVGDPLAPMRKRAESGEVAAMITLGRTYESLGTPEGKLQAKQWYEKAAATGDPSAQEALKNLASAASQPAVAEAPEPLIQNSVPSVGATTNPSAASASPPQQQQPPTSTGPVDLAHLRWAEVLGAVDTKDFVSVANPHYVPKTGGSPTFVGLSTAPDKTMTIAGSGPSGDDIQMVSVVMRVRNKQDLANSIRVLQAAAVTNKVTRENVTQKEFIEWVQQYLNSNLESPPIFRNGWKISISGPAAKGMRDPKEFLGTAVLVEMKK